MRLVPLVLIAGCAPVYVPNMVRAPQLQAPGDVSLSAQGGMQGFQLDAAFAPARVLGIRAGVHGQYGEVVRYGLVTTGVGAYYARGGLRLAGWVDVGAGYGRGRSEITVTSSNSTTTAVYQLEGALLQVNETFEIGWEDEYFAAGGELRFVEHAVFHGPDSEADEPIGDITTFEPVGFVRIGGPSVKAQFFTGVMIPLRNSGSVGVPWPLLGGVGIVWDFGKDG
ncbi:MAG: hypothetical protein H6737_03255 [Alphaproteobacteria bacterium]|nr:hypothetical protein [Alphaproteobacteria bacterium]